MVESILDIVNNLQKLTKKMSLLEKRCEQLENENKKFKEDWVELIVYRKHGNADLVELTWTGEEDDTKREYYDSISCRRDVIGKLKV